MTLRAAKTRPVEVPAVDIRPLRTHADLRACVELQREIWGAEFQEVVPPTLLKISQRIGGVAAGAFDPRGRLLGFVFGLTGVGEDGRPVHWSDMLAVRPESRSLGLGRRLKEFQRARVRDLGVEVIYWTYDPLVARNAHLNLNRLGAEVVEYVEDMYGESASALHRGLGTDRFVVAWRIARRSPSPSPAAAADAPDPGDVSRGASETGTVRVEVPREIHAVQARSLAEAARWRAVTREAFLAHLGRGYRVAGFQTDPDGRCHYLLVPP